MDEFGLKIEAGLDRATSVTYEISEVYKRSFKLPHPLTVYSKEIEKFQRSEYCERYKKCLIANILWYATRFTVKFEGISQADWEMAISKIKTASSMKFEKKQIGEIEVSSDPTIPFGFSPAKKKIRKKIPLKVARIEEPMTILSADRENMDVEIEEDFEL